MKIQDNGAHLVRCCRIYPKEVGLKKNKTEKLLVLKKYDL